MRTLAKVTHSLWIAVGSAAECCVSAQTAAFLPCPNAGRPPGTIPRALRRGPGETARRPGARRSEPRRPGGFPVNPNGSEGDVAGLCDATGRVLGLMPHPERHFLPTQHPRWTRLGLATEGDGLALFRNAIRYFL